MRQLADWIRVSARRYSALRTFLEERGIRSYDESFTCPGHFLFLHKDRPNEKDLEALKAFVREARAKLGV